MSGRGLGKMEPRKRDSARLKSAPCTGYHLQLGPPPSGLPPTGTKIQGLTAGLQKPAEETILGSMQQVTLLPDWPDDDEDACHLESSPPQEAHFAPALRITEQVRRHSGPLSGPPQVKHGLGKANRSMPLTTVMEDGTIYGAVGLNQPVTNNGVHTQVGWGADMDDRDVSSTAGSLLTADFGIMRPTTSGNSPTSTLEEPWSHDMSRGDGGKSRSWKDRLTTAATKIKDISTKAPATILRRMNPNVAQLSSNPSTPDSLTSPSPTFRTLWDQDLRASEGWPVVANYSGGADNMNKRFLFGASRPLVLEQWEDRLFGAGLNGSGAFPELEADGFQTNTQTDSAELRMLTASSRASAPAPTPSPSPLHLNTTNCCETGVREMRHPPSPELGVTDDGNANDDNNDNNKPLPIPPLLQWSYRKSSTSTHDGVPHSGILSCPTGGGKIDAQRDSNRSVASGEPAVENAFERLQNGVSIEQEELKKGLVLVGEREGGGSEGGQSTGTESSYGLGVGEIDTENVGSREGREERELNLPKFSRLIEKKGEDEEAYAVGDHRTNRRVAVPRFQWEIEKQGGGTRASDDATGVALPDEGGRKKSHSWSGEEKSETKVQHMRKRSFPLDSSSRLAPPSSLAEKKGAEVDHHVISSEAEKATCGSNPEQEYLQSSGDDCEVLREVVERVVREMHEKGLTSKNYMRRLESKRAIVREAAAKQHHEETAAMEERKRSGNASEASTAEVSNSMIVASNPAEDMKGIVLVAEDEGRLVVKSNRSARTVIGGWKENARRDRAAETVKESKKNSAENVALSADVKGCEEAQVASAVVGDKRTSSAMLRRREAAAEFWGVRPGNLAPGVCEDWQTWLDLLPDEGMGLDEDGSGSSSDGDLDDGCDLQAPSDAESMLVNPGSPRKMPLSSTLQKIQEVPVIAKIRPQTHRLSDIRVQTRHLHTWGPSTTATSSRSCVRRPSPVPARTSSATFLHNGVPLKSCLRDGDRREHNNVVAVCRRFPSPRATWQVPDRPSLRPPSPSIVRTGIWRDGRWHDIVDVNLIRRTGREAEEDPGKSFKEELSQKLQAAAAAQKVRRAERLRVSFESPVVQSSWSATDRRLSVWSDPGPEGTVAMYDMDDVVMGPARMTHGDCRPFAAGGLEALRLAIKGEDSEEFLRKSYPG